MLNEISLFASSFIFIHSPVFQQIRTSSYSSQMIKVQTPVATEIKIKMPNLDALQMEHYSLTLCNNGELSTSRSVVLTGLHNHLNGQCRHQHNYHKFSSFHNTQSLQYFFLGMDIEHLGLEMSLQVRV